MQITIIRSNRKSLSLTVQKDGIIQVRAPYRMNEREIMAFVDNHRGWIEKQESKVEQLEQMKQQVHPLSDEELHKLGAEASRYFAEKTRFYAKLLNVSYGRITIRNQKSKWGSCTSAGNLNFNCMLMLAPEEIRDYVIVHELCHRKHMDHSPAFWAEVEAILPNYREAKKWLKDHGSYLMLQNPNQ